MCAGVAGGPEPDAGLLAGPPLRSLLHVQGRSPPGFRRPFRHWGRALAGSAPHLTSHHLISTHLFPPHHSTLMQAPLNFTLSSGQQ